MRSITVGFVLLALVLALGVVASGEDGAGDKISKLEKQIELLDAQVSYLAAREASLTTYLLSTEEYGKALRTTLAKSRVEGFTQAAISSTSRELLLRGLEGYAGDIARDLPQLTKEEQQLLRKVQILKRTR